MSSTQEKLEQIRDILSNVSMPATLGEEKVVFYRKGNEVRDALLDILDIIDLAKREKLDRLLKWNEEWTKTHDEPFNWVGAIKSLELDNG